MEAKKEAEMRRVGEGDGPENTEIAAKKVRRRMSGTFLVKCCHVMASAGVGGVLVCRVMKDGWPKRGI